MLEFFKSVREEWPVIKQAPRTFIISFLLLLCVGYGALYLLFRETLSLKSDLIQTLQEQVKVLKKGAGKSGETLKQPTPLTGAATAYGDHPIANTGNGNSFGDAAQRKQLNTPAKE